MLNMQQFPPTPRPEPSDPYPPPVLSSEPEPVQRGSWYSALSTILILIAAPVVALLLTAFVFQSYEVDGPSMEPTLQNRDRLIVLKVPRTVARITGEPYIPKRNDIIVFVKHGLPESAGVREDKQLIKRVIGLPGDRVVVKDGAVTVFNSENPAGFDPDASSEHGAAITTTSGESDVVVEEGQVFVAGDNRGNSLDSRTFGPIESSDIVGKLILRIFPLDKADTF